MPRAAWTQLPPGREKGPQDSSLPGPHPINPLHPPPPPPVLLGPSIEGEGRCVPGLETKPRPCNRLNVKRKSWGMQVWTRHPYVYSWTMHEHVPDASTQATSLCLLGTQLYTSAHWCFWHPGACFTPMRMYMQRRTDARAVLRAETCARTLRGALCNTAHSVAHWQERRTQS